MQKNSLLAIGSFLAITGPISLFAQTISGTNAAGSSAVAAATNSSHSSVKVTPFPDAEVKILPYNSEYSALAEAITTLPNLRQMLPYSVVLKNGTAKSIIAYTVSWTTITDTASTPYTSSRTVRATEDVSSQIAPSGSKVITIARQPSEDVTTYLERFQNSALTIQLEAVMFEDGTTMGDDTSQSMDQVKGDLRSEYDLLTTILSLKQSLVLPHLKEVAQAHKPGEMIDLTKGPFKEWYKYFQAQLARRLLSTAQSSGVAALLADVQVMFQSKRYPANIESWGN